ncbi:MAG TPA: hypothetical protein VFQ90_12605, partial [Stellaceae bacterium]|nr:hypothetical protein [Stellaceae bacterium]
ARSGYEVAMEQSGKKPDPHLKQFGRGGMSGGYLARYQIIEQLRQRYFALKSIIPVSVDKDISAVPIEFINNSLKEMAEPWRARITPHDQYEFYVP